MSQAPASLAGAWQVEMDDRQLAAGTPGEDDARALFYTGAAAMMAMTVTVLATDPRPTHQVLDDFFTRMTLEISEYLDKTPWPDNG